MNRLGLYLSPAPGRDGGFERALWADREGFDDIWFPDGDGMRDAMTFAATVAGRTERVRLCTGITPVYTRVPAVIATSTLAVNRVAPGRFALGLGSSTHTMVESWYGVPFEQPLARVRETTELVRSLLAGGKSRYEGATLRSRGFRLKESIVGEIPIFLAGMGPRMLELAGEVADGVILNHFTPLDRVPWALECIERGAKRSGRRLEDLEIAQRVAVWVTDDDAAARKFFSTDFSFYGSTAVYRDVIGRMGYPDAAEEIRKGFEVRDRARIMAAVPDEAIERMYVWGDRESCYRRIREYYAAGVDTVVVASQATNADDYAATCEAFRPAAFRPGARSSGREPGKPADADGPIRSAAPG